MDWLTDKKFLVGLAVGFFVAPRVIMFARAKLGGATAPAQA
jgi:hypothetical protein